MRRTPLRPSTKPLQRKSTIGAPLRQRVQHERDASKALEGVPGQRLGLFDLHRVDWFHNEQPQRDRGTLKEGVPDYLIIGKGWKVWLEIKANVPTNKETGQKRYTGSLSPGQRKFHALLEQAGDEVWTAWLPDDLKELNEKLEALTGRSVDVDGLI